MIFKVVLPKGGTMRDKRQGQESLFNNNTCNALMLFATVSWQHTIL